MADLSVYEQVFFCSLGGCSVWARKFAVLGLCVTCYFLVKLYHYDVSY